MLDFSAHLCSDTRSNNIGDAKAISTSPRATAIVYGDCVHTQDTAFNGRWLAPIWSRVTCRQT